MVLIGGATRVTGARMAKARIGTCTYCGQEKRLERDHVIPKTLFITLDPDMVTVPCCSDCNRKKSLGDKDLRIFVNLHRAGALHPDALIHVDRLLQRGGPTAEWLGRSVQSARPADIKTNAGIIVGRGVEFPFNRQRMYATLRMIVRGLLHYETGVPPNPLTDVLAWEISPGDVPATLKVLEAYAPNVNKSIGNQVAQWVGWTNFEDMTPNDTAWLLGFNGGVWFFALTGALPALRQTEANNSNP
jgi:hypothetical protein